MRLFWNMPGPLRFLKGFRDGAAQGKSVVVRCPRVGFSKTGEAIRDYLRDNEHSCHLVEPVDGELRATFYYLPETTGWNSFGGLWVAKSSS